MQAVKVGWVWKTFALASSNESSRKKPRSRKTKEERRAMVESFITKYRSSNNGNFPSLSLTQKGVGGSFYTVREIMKEIIKENESCSTSILALENQALSKVSSQIEELNLATLSSTDVHGIGEEQGSFILNDSYQSHMKSSELLANTESQEESSELEKQVHESDHKQEHQLCSGELNESMIDEADKTVTQLGLAEREDVKVEDIESFSPPVDDLGNECIELSRSIDNHVPLFNICDKNWSFKADESAKEDQKLPDSQIVNQLDNERPKEARVSDGSSFILVQFEESSLGELKASDTVIENVSQDENFDDHDKNLDLEYDSTYNSEVGYNQSEAGILDNVLAGNSSVEVSDQVVPVHALSILDDFSDEATVETKESIMQNASVPVDLTFDETNSAESLSLPSNCKQENTFLESLITENSASTLSQTSENDSLSSQLNSLQEDEDFQVVTCCNDGSSTQNVDGSLFVPALKSEVRVDNSLEKADANSDADASNKEFLNDAMTGRSGGFDAEAGVLSGSSSSNTGTLLSSFSEWKLVVRRKTETNPWWAVMKAFLRAFIKFWTE